MALGIPEIPKHTHIAEKPIYRAHGANKSGGAPKPNGFTKVEVTPAGEGKPHNNMPPFYTLHYCIKK